MQEKCDQCQLHRCLQLHILVKSIGVIALNVIETIFSSSSRDYCTDNYLGRLSCENVLYSREIVHFLFFEFDFIPSFMLSVLWHILIMTCGRNINNNLSFFNFVRFAL